MTKVDIVARYFREFNKVADTINSCISETQLRNSEIYVNLFVAKWHNSLVGANHYYSFNSDVIKLNSIIDAKFKSLNLHF